MAIDDMGEEDLGKGWRGVSVDEVEVADRRHCSSSSVPKNLGQIKEGASGGD